MSSSTESNFRNSLRGFNSNSRGGGVQLPANTNDGGNAFSRGWSSFTSGAVDAIDNARRTVQGYVPVNAQEEVDEPWFQMSRWEVCVQVFSILTAYCQVLPRLMTLILDL
jgi:hypothetical protein